MRNLIWIAAGFMAGYYIAKKTPVVAKPENPAPDRSAIPNQGLVSHPGVGACPGDRLWPARYLNCNSQEMAKMTM